jgi:hypothetical protein
LIVVFSEAFEWIMKLTRHLNLVPKLRMSGVIPLRPLYELYGVFGDNLTIFIKTEIKKNSYL